MCGIAGIFHKQSYEEVERMLDKIKHRGPDGMGIKNLPNGTLGHIRLAIIDIEGGSQPMEMNGAWIVFNGEIYNFRELIEEHLADIQLQTHSDTEVILHLYHKFGPKCVDLLNGMFSFAIMDKEFLFIARDPLGIKPLYFGEKDGGFYFASEIKALALITDDIHEFPSGAWYHSQTGWNVYYEIKSTPLIIQDEQGVIEKIRSILTDSVTKRLIADVPVGISLSGGLDSSIVALLANQNAQHLHSFAVGMDGSEDIQAARMMADFLGTIHHEKIYTDDEMLDVLPSVIFYLESFDPSLVRSAIPNFFLAEMTSKYVKVFLTGEGADEIYAGYDYLMTYSDPLSLQKEMIDITSALHNTNLQRADRMSMAFGLEARVPFLDIDSVALGLGIPAKWKIHNDRPAKFLLRKAFSSELPEVIANRPKQKYSKGAGSADVISQKVERDISAHEFYSERDRLNYQWNYCLPNKEALYYYRILHQFYQDDWIFPSFGYNLCL